MDTKGTCQSVRIMQALRFKDEETCFIDKKTKGDIFKATKIVLKP